MNCLYHFCVGLNIPLVNRPEDRDLSLIIMVRIRTKMCDRCQLPSNVLYRVRVDKSGDWQFVCDKCWQLLDRDNPDYVYSGTWKARKR